MLPYRSVGTRPFAGISDDDLIPVQCAHLLCIKAKIIAAQRSLPAELWQPPLPCSVSPLMWTSLLPAPAPPAARA